ncbi:MAG TPA: hypothetical protein VIL79_11305 [Thermoleophilia bacterium]
MNEPSYVEPKPGTAETEAATSASKEATPPVEEEAPGLGGGFRLLAAAVTVPWLVGYGVTGAWAVTRGARAAAAGLSSVDVGYSGMVTPFSVILVGALLLAGFAVLLAAAMLVLYDARGRVVWAAVCAVAALLTAGSVWAAVSGGLHPGLWLLFFGGLLYAAALSLVELLLVTRVARRGTIVGP